MWRYFKVSQNISSVCQNLGDLSGNPFWLTTMLKGGAKLAAGLSGRSWNISLGIFRNPKSCHFVKTICNRSSFRSFSVSTLPGDESNDDGKITRDLSSHSVQDSSVIHDVEDEGVDCSSLDICSSSAIDGITQLSGSDLGSSPVHVAIQLVENVHIATGIPYWESIALTTLAVRLVLLPTAMIVARDVSRMRALKPELKSIRESMNSKISPDDPTKKYKYIEQINKLFAANDIHPVKTVSLAAFQFPIFISFFFGMRQMGNYFPEFATGGDYWFVDLSAADPTYILPCLNALSFLLMIEISAGNGQRNPLKWVCTCL